MATILDVAKKAGVSQGTVSNVLNGKGNVSSEKIRAVEEAARELGYTINERAKMLRKGSGNVICVILPTIEFKQYRELYNSIKFCAEQKGVFTELLISNDNAETEIELVQHAQSIMALGVVTISCLKKHENPYQTANLKKICFVERKPLFASDYYGFNYTKAGSDMAEMILNKQYRDVIVVTGRESFSNESEYLQGFRNVMNQENGCSCNVEYISTDLFRISNSMLHVISMGRKIDSIVVSNAGYAERIIELVKTFIPGHKIDVYSMAQITSLPDHEFISYELNYSRLGKKIAEKLIDTDEETFVDEQHIFENDGIRKWGDEKPKKDTSKTINVLALDGPEAVIIQNLARLYTNHTGINVKVAIFSYEDIYTQFLNAEVLDLYDVIRIDVSWLSWFAGRLLMPLEEIDADITDVFEEYIPALLDKYAYIRGKVYALPITPSVQLLFYRKDLFENTGIKRLYQEKYKEELKIPDSFEKYNQIAEFFTNLDSAEYNVKYGASVTLGNFGVAASEFLARFFSYKEHLYDENGKIIINNEYGKKAMQELIDGYKNSSGKESRWWTTTAKEFSDGQTAMMITFSNFASEILGVLSKIADKVGCAMVPGGNPIYGGGSLGISKNSKHKKEAMEFIKWLTREPVSSAMAALGSVSPCRKTYDRYDIIRSFPWLELSKECFQLSRTKRTRDEGSSFDEKKFVNIVGAAVKETVMEISDIDVALERAQMLIDMEFNNESE